MLKKKFSSKKNNSGYNLIDADEILADSVSSLQSPFTPEGKLERKLSRRPSIIFLVFIVLGIFYLSYRAFALQVSEGESLFVKSQQNRFITRPIYPPRGIVYDRNNIPLVRNQPSFGLIFNKNAFLRSKGNLEELLENLGFILNKDNVFLRELRLPFSMEDLMKTPAQIFISQNISLQKAVEITSKQEDFPGVEVFESYKREYINPEANSAVLGFIGKISQNDLAKNPKLVGEETVGKDGLESFYDEKLRGKKGKKIIEVNSSGQQTQFKLVEEPKEGDSLRLTIDEELQKKVYDLLEHYTESKKGASAVAIDPRNGAVRALVSFPGFNSTHLSSGLNQTEFAALLDNPLKPFFNRAIAGEFPSGSIIKPLLASAALQENIIDPNKEIYDPGFLEIPNPYYPDQKSVFMDWRPQGWINFYDAIALSANVYFYIIGGGYKDQQGLGVEKIKNYLEKFGLGSKLGLNLPGEKSGFVPDPETKKEYDPQNPVWRVGDTYNLSIGQGNLRVTPLQMATAAATIVNGGKLYKPRLLDNEPVEVIRQDFINENNLDEVIKGMKQTVTSGTAKMLQDLPVEVGAKTGTAQTGINIAPHAWAMTFAPAEEPELVLIVMIENGGEGSSIAIPISNDLYKWYFNRKTFSD